jgi:hypothetical protein
MDTIGNIIWRKTTDSLKVSCFQMSNSGKYTLGYSETATDYREIVLWNTLTNEVLFKKDFPNYSIDSIYSIWARIIENTETGHAFIRVLTPSDTLYFLPDGSDLNLDFNQVEDLEFDDFGYLTRRIGNMLKIYKLRW